MWSKLPDDFILHIFGEGSYSNYVESKAKEAINIVYYGFRQHEDLLKDLENSVAVIIASECYETFGMLIPESFSRSVPVITTDIGNPAQMVKESNGGVIYKLKDFDSFRGAINTLLSNRSNYSNNAYKYYRDNLSEEVNYKRLIEIYEKARK